MFETWKLMDAIHGRSLRPFIQLALVSCGLNVLMYGVKGAFVSYSTKGVTLLYLGFYFYAIVWISVIALLILHLRFQMRFIKGGGLTRMQVLPMRKSTYLLEEVLFIFLTICMLLFSVYVSLLLIYFFYGNVQGQVDNGFIYMVLNNKFLVDGILPLNGQGIFSLMAILFALTMLFMVFIQSIGNGMLLVENIFLLIMVAVICFMLINFVIEQRFADISTLLYAGEMILIGITLFIRMQFAFRSGKIGG